MRRAIPSAFGCVLALFAGTLLAGTATAQKAGNPPDVFTPRPAPTADVPKLTPRAVPEAGAPQPRAALTPAPVVAPPLSPVVVPGGAPTPAPAPVAAPPKVEAAPSAVVAEPAPAPLPAPARKPERAAEKPPAPPQPLTFKGPYAKASKEDRGCALPDAIPEKHRPSIAVGSAARVLADANLRVAPVCDAKVKDVLEDGETVTVMGVYGRWYQVGRHGRALGYVGAALLAEVKKR
ncbi:SH3 domain-containing protein [Azospirillum sp. sgz302134]